MSVFNRDVPLPENPPDMTAATPRFSFGERFSAGWTDEKVRTDAWFYTQRVRNDLLQEMYDSLPDDARPRVDRASASNRLYGVDPTGGPGAAERREMAILDEIGKLAAMPDGYRGLPLSAEQLDEAVDLRRKETLEEAEFVGALDGSGVAGFLGSSARAMTDESSLMMAPLGGPPSAALKFIATEAVLGALGEAAVLPREFRVAEELGLEDPDAFTRLAFGAAFGGVLGGAVVGAPRALPAGRRAASYAADRIGKRTEGRPEGVGQQEFDAQIEKARSAIERGEGPDLSGFRPADQTHLGEVDLRLQHIFAEVRRRHPDMDFQIADGRRTVEEQRRNVARGVSQTMNSRHLHGGALDIKIVRNGKYVDDLAEYRQIADLVKATARDMGYRVTWGGDWKSLVDGPHFQIEDGPPILPEPGNDVPDFAGYRTQRGYTSSGQVTAGEGRQIDVDYEVVDASLLQAASGRLQPRDRSRAQSDEQIARLAAGLDPARLMPAPEADRGAPIVGPDNIVESGNGRVAAIRRAAERHPDRFAAYRTQIEAAGFEIPEGVETPVLIARRRTDFDDAARERFVRDANSSTVARMSATERAAASARDLEPATLALYDPAEPLGARANRGFVNRALSGFSQSERNAFFSSDGNLNAEGVRTLREAMFARAYDAPDILARYAETDAGELKSLMDALEQAAPAWAALRSDIIEGRVRPEFDITRFMLDAMRMIASAREIAAREGGSVRKALDDLLAQTDLLDGAISPVTRGFVTKFWRNGRAARAADIADFLSRYATEARKVGGTDAGLFDDAPSPADVLKRLDDENFGGVREDDIPAPPPAEVPTAPVARGSAEVDGYAEGAASPEAELADDIAAEALAPEPQQSAVASAEQDLEPLKLDDIEMELDGIVMRGPEILRDLDDNATLQAVLDACPIGRASA